VPPWQAYHDSATSIHSRMPTPNRPPHKSRIVPKARHGPMHFTRIQVQYSTLDSVYGTHFISVDLYVTSFYLVLPRFTSFYLHFQVHKPKHQYRGRPQSAPASRIVASILEQKVTKTEYTIYGRGGRMWKVSEPPQKEAGSQHGATPSLGSVWGFRHPSLQPPPRWLVARYLSIITIYGQCS